MAPGRRREPPRRGTAKSEARVRRRRRREAETFPASFGSGATRPTRSRRRRMGATELLRDPSRALRDAQVSMHREEWRVVIPRGCGECDRSAVDWRSRVRTSFQAEERSTPGLPESTRRTKPTAPPASLVCPYGLEGVPVVRRDGEAGGAIRPGDPPRRAASRRICELRPRNRHGKRDGRGRPRLHPPVPRQFERNSSSVGFSWRASASRPSHSGPSRTTPRSSSSRSGSGGSCRSRRSWGRSASRRWDRSRSSRPSGRDAS